MPHSPHRKTVRPQWWKRAIRCILWISTLFFALGLLVASYAGKVEPQDFPIAPVLLLTYPIWIYGTFASLILDIFACRRALLVAIPAVAACIPALWAFAPLNFTTPQIPEGDEGRTFTLMTYNVGAFHNFTYSFPGDLNPTMSYLINSDADVVNLQEVYTFATSESEHITALQVDSIYREYPYVMTFGEMQAMLSKYPADPVSHNWRNVKGNEVAVFRLFIDGEPVTIVNVHLQSYGLTASDKLLYREITEMDALDFAKIDSVRTTLMSKINAAAQQRASDAHHLGELIKRFGGPNVIVAGDFNDVPGCYTLNYLADLGFHDVYSEVGFGPDITYNSDRFYFRIDHVLYRGALKPLSIRRGRIRSSDHYPLIVKFALTDD